MFFINPPFGNYLNLPNTISIKGSYTLNPRPGLFSQILKTLRYSFKYEGWVNKIGLRNPGLDYAIKNYCKRHIVSIAICDEKEIPEILKKIPNDMNIELNVSCPNHKIIKNTENNELKGFINSEREWCIVKLSPYVDKQLIDDYYDIGFRQFHCSNTIPLGDRGGLSGRFIIPYTAKLIKYLKQKEDVIVIAGGGVRDMKTVQYYRKCGADHISASTVFFNPFLSTWLYLNYVYRFSNNE